jgi:predicted peptidase
MKDVRIMVEQVGALVSGSGAAIPPGDMVFTTKTVNAVTDDFLEGEFEGLKYNLFIPKNYDGNKSYPLVHFIVDSWGVGPDCKVTLAQGLGGTVWAFPQEQAKRECFVLSPQFPGPTIVEDDYSVADALETAKRLIDHVVGAYRIDRSRIYHTGQSMGYLAGCELNIRYPDLFAGCLFVSGFWNPETMTALKDKNIWFLVSAGDHARQKMDAAIANLEAGGADVARYAWDAAEGVGAIDEKVRDACKEWHRIRYTVFDKGSAEAATYPYGDHRATWLFCYQVEALREWLFSTRKDA